MSNRANRLVAEVFMNAGRVRGEGMVRTVTVGTNASGAVKAARAGDVVVIVDVIDMSTGAEAALDAGAIAIYGASPDGLTLPVRVEPEKIGYIAGKTALKYGTDVILVSEPRSGMDEERRRRAKSVLSGIKTAGANLGSVVPSLGAELVRLTDVAGKVVIFCTDSGGVAFDAAYNHGAPAVITGTIARTLKKKGLLPAKAASARAIELAQKHDTGIAIIAASSNSLEDLLAAHYIAGVIIDQGFLLQK